MTSHFCLEYLSFTDISRTLSNLEVYALCKCNLVLVVANDTEDFPFSINHDPVELYFRSRSLRKKIFNIKIESIERCGNNHESSLNVYQNLKLIQD